MTLNSDKVSYSSTYQRSNFLYECGCCVKKKSSHLKHLLSGVNSGEDGFLLVVLFVAIELGPQNIRMCHLIFTKFKSEIIKIAVSYNVGHLILLWQICILFKHMRNIKHTIAIKILVAENCKFYCCYSKKNFGTLKCNFRSLKQIDIVIVHISCGRCEFYKFVKKKKQKHYILG